MVDYLTAETVKYWQCVLFGIYRWSRELDSQTRTVVWRARVGESDARLLLRRITGRAVITRLVRGGL